MPFSTDFNRFLRNSAPPRTLAAHKTGLIQVQKRTTSGFSILELLTVIAIMGVLSVLAMPLSKKFLDQMHLRVTGDSIKNQLSIAKMRAISDPNIPCGVYFDVTSSPQKTIIFIDQTGGKPYVYDEGVDTRYLKEIVIPKGLTLKIPDIAAIQNNSVVFRADGSAKTGGNILLTDNSGKVRRINILPSTGRVKIFRN